MTLVAFVDVDGPVIPATFLLHDVMACYDRHFPPTTLAVLRRLCERTGALLVVNSTHSDAMPGAPEIVEAFVQHGLDRAFFHPTAPKTRHPELPRDEAVLEWLSRRPDVSDWVAFDDSAFTQDERLILVDPDAGLTIAHLNRALIRFGQPAIGMLM